jgi:hypothetical protein
MPRPQHYSPCIRRDLVRALYHEARSRRKPMTQLVNELLAEALQGSSGWQTAQDTCVLQEPPDDYRARTR